MTIRYLFLSLVFFIVSFPACKPDIKDKQPEDNITEQSLAAHTRLKNYIDSVFLTNSATQDSFYTTKEIYKDCTLIATGVQGDSLTPELLFKAGALVKGRNDPTKAIGVWALITEHYPDSKWAADAMFQKAFTFDNDLHDKQLAKQYYENFLKTYPDHNLAEDIKLLIPTLDKTDAQLIEEFEKKNKL